MPFTLAVVVGLSRVTLPELASDEGASASEGGDHAQRNGWTGKYPIWTLACGRRGRSRPAAERARQVRLLCTRAVLVAVLLRAGGRARATPAVRRAALFVRGAWAVATIRKGLSGILPEPGAAARSHHRLVDAGSDAGAAADLQRVGQARGLLRPAGARLFRDHSQGTRRGEDPAGLSGAEGRAHCFA